MMSNDHRWHHFFKLYSENAEIVRVSPAYYVMLTEYSTLLMIKAAETAMMGPSKEVRMHAAIVVQELTETDLLENNYLNLPVLALASLRQCALALIIEEVGTDVQEAGLLLTVDLLRQSLHHNDIRGWPELLHLLDRAFTENLEILDLFINVISELPTRYVSSFVTFLAPCLLRYHDAFINTLRWMLAQGDDHRVFLLLPCLYAHLTEASWKTLLGAAISTPFFHNETQSSLRVLAAQNLETSVKITEYSFSRDWVPPMNAIITVLLRTHPDRPNDSREMILGDLLRNAMSMKHYD